MEKTPCKKILIAAEKGCTCGGAGDFGRRIEYDLSVNEVKQATFKTWSIDFEEIEEIPCHFPAAVIEYDDGQVDIVYAKRIRFLGK